MLHIEDVQRAFDEKMVLRGVDLQISEGEIVCLLGPSGSGKTTLLRIVAGLEKLDSGDVCFAGQSIIGVSVHLRDFGLMFQDFALFPHMDIASNVGFGLKMHGVHDPQRVQEVIHLVGLAGFEHRDVGQLSGGEKQRVALARSLALRPRLLMLDEPLGSLDAALRSRLVIDLRQIIKQIGLTGLYVTHDQMEAFAIADRIAIMNDGIIEQTDAPEVIYRQPATAFVATFLGLNNLVRVEHYDGRLAHTAVGIFPLERAAPMILLHPLGLRIAGADDPGIEGHVQQRVFLGDAYQIKLMHDSGVMFNFKMPANANHAPVEGDVVKIHVLPDAVIPLEESASHK